MTSNFENSHTPAASLYDSLIRHKPVVNMMRENDMQSGHLTWDMYHRYCQQPAWEQENRINVQLRCSQLDGQLIRWEGIVDKVEISRVANYRSDLIFNYLPSFWSDLISCWYGERNRAHCNEREDCDEIKTLLDDQKRCNLNAWNTYEYDITVRMPASGLLRKYPEVVLRGQHSFGNFTQRLNVSDRIWFKGRLRNTREERSGSTGSDDKIFMTLGKSKPLVDLTAIGCVSCTAGKGLDVFQVVDGLTVNDRIKDLYRGVKYLLNVLLNPLVTFK